MNPVVAAVVAGAIIVAGKWSKGKSPSVDNAVGVAGIAIMLSLIETGNAKLANSFAWLILVSLSVVYIPSIVKAAGLADSK
jgi:hypothetical protein